MDFTEKTVGSEFIFDGKVVHLYKDEVSLPNGKTSFREYVKHNGAVCIVPITENGEIILESQYRYAVRQELIEIPAGKLDTPDEDPHAAALRELKEETGAVPDELTYLGDYYGSPAIMGERIYMFMAKGLKFGERHLDDDEFLDVFTMPLDEAVKQVLDGKITDGKTQVGILRAAMMK